MLHQPIPNPEQLWDAAQGVRAVDASEVEARIGPFTGPLCVLSGGLANTNVEVAGRVLRIYRREPGVARLEEALLRRSWSSFRVPAIVSSGSDFLLLEHVAHGPVRGSAEHGAAVGRALAEIHALTFPQAGFLTPELRVAPAFSDLVTGLVDYARLQLASSNSGMGAELAERVQQALEANAPTLREVCGAPVLLHADFKASNLHWAADDRLLVLDWEFAYSGSRLSDVGQLLRWRPPLRFVTAFAESYVANGGSLPDEYETWAGLFDLVNLASLVANVGAAGQASARSREVRQRVRELLSGLERTKRPQGLGG